MYIVCCFFVVILWLVCFHSDFLPLYVFLFYFHIIFICHAFVSIMSPLSGFKTCSLLKIQYHSHKGLVMETFFPLALCTFHVSNCTFSGPKNIIGQSASQRPRRRSEQLGIDNGISTNPSHATISQNFKGLFEAKEC